MGVTSLEEKAPRLRPTCSLQDETGKVPLWALNIEADQANVRF